MTVLSARGWATGAGAVVVLVASGVWAMRPAEVDDGLWGRVRPVLEDGLEARGADEGEPASQARWFCRAEALGLEEYGDAVRADVDTLCVEYGVREDALVECAGAQVPQVVRLERDASAAGGYRIVSREEPPEGAGVAQWVRARFGVVAASAVQDPMSSDALAAEARAHFDLPADAGVGDC
ncbi:hypothetical protein [Streptomyces sp. NPDC088254]|uniref:hypothetical protein n=1 Tax=Streptomyces sp. NPDC088254 TaxID=3365847 RepID=UPI003811CB9E